MQSLGRRDLIDCLSIGLPLSTATYIVKAERHHCGVLYSGKTLVGLYQLVEARQEAPMKLKSRSKTRPYWHVDAKWLTGIILTLTLSLSLLVFSLVSVTAEKPAIDTLTIGLALAFSQNGLDDEAGIAELRQALKLSPDGTIRPISGLKVVIREQDITGLTPRQVRLYLFRQIAEPLYKQGPEGLAALAGDPAMEKKMVEDSGALGFLTLKTHRTLNSIFLVLGAVSLVLFVPLVLFSYRFGRITSPGIVMFISSLPGALVFSGASLALHNSGGNLQQAKEVGMGGMASFIASNILPPIIQTIARDYLIILLAGLGLIIVSILGRFIYWLIRRKQGSSVLDAGGGDAGEA